MQSRDHACSSPSVSPVPARAGGDGGGSKNATHLPPRLRKPVRVKQSDLNGSTRGQWALFDSHRRKIEQCLSALLPPTTPLLLGSPPSRPCLCVLGAGNCNDLDLKWLSHHYAQVHLVDLDREALQEAVRRQDVADHEQIVRHAPVDLAAIAPTLDRWLFTPPGPAEIEAAISEACAAALPTLPAPFDVVLSPCLLSQLIAPARDLLGSAHPRFPPLREAIVGRHLRLLLDLLRPGGWAVFICDVVSSDTVPYLPRVPEEELSALIRSLAAEQKTFRCLDPASIGAVLDADPRLGRRVQSRRWMAPWLWHISPRRTYLVYALCLRKLPA